MRLWIEWFAKNKNHKLNEPIKCLQTTTADSKHDDDDDNDVHNNGVGQWTFMLTHGKFLIDCTFCNSKQKHQIKMVLSDIWPLDKVLLWWTNCHLPAQCYWMKSTLTAFFGPVHRIQIETFAVYDKLWRKSSELWHCRCSFTSCVHTAHFIIKQVN